MSSAEKLMDIHQTKLMYMYIIMYIYVAVVQVLASQYSPGILTRPTRDGLGRHTLQVLWKIDPNSYDKYYYFV